MTRYDTMRHGTIPAVRCIGGGTGWGVGGGGSAAALSALKEDDASMQYSYLIVCILHTNSEADYIDGQILSRQLQSAARACSERSGCGCSPANIVYVCNRRSVRWCPLKPFAVCCIPLSFGWPKEGQSYWTLTRA